jgi:hypothetical protein
MHSPSATDLDATSCHRVQQATGNPGKYGVSRDPAPDERTAGNTATVTQPSSRKLRNVASDATPRLCHLVAAECRNQCGSNAIPVLARSRRTRS